MFVVKYSPTASTLGKRMSSETGGCSPDWPARKRDADGVKITRMES